MRSHDADRTRWLVTLAAGGVVVAVVAGLLEVLRRSVDDVDDAVQRVWTTGKLVAQNTQVAHLLANTRQASDALRVELGVPNGTRERTE